MKRIYTKTGDRGTTGIHGGARVPKDDIRIEANGCLDELNCQIGLVRATLETEHESQPLLHTIQRKLMVAMSLVATPAAIREEKNPNHFSSHIIHACEREMDRLTPLIEDHAFFVLPGGTPAAAQMQMARAIARRAERRLWTLHRVDPVPEAILIFLNRLSDLFFVMARFETQRQGWPEERWRAFAYKREMKQK